jgi:copper homeostasis protein
MRKIVFELCAETVAACVAAREGGADRIELCSALREGGLTPSQGLLKEALRGSRLPVHVMVRPRAGGFVYSADEITEMAEEIAHFKWMGAAGVVLGVLLPDGCVDVETTRRLVDVARPMEVTFHRAFDEVPSLPAALEKVIATGCGRVLTSGGRSDVLQGATVLAGLVEQAGERINVAVGGGLRLENAVAVAQVTGATHFHGSLQMQETCDPERVRTMMQRLREA